MFQIFAQLIEVRGPGEKLPDAYLLIFPPLLTPVFWERSGNVPALVRLLQVRRARHFWGRARVAAVGAAYCGRAGGWRWGRLRGLLWKMAPVLVACACTAGSEQRPLPTAGSCGNAIMCWPAPVFCRARHRRPRLHGGLRMTSPSSLLPCAAASAAPAAQAYLSHAAGEVVARGYLAGVLGVFQKLLSAKAHDHEGFYILNTLVEYLDLAALAQVRCAVLCYAMLYL